MSKIVLALSLSVLTLGGCSVGVASAGRGGNKTTDGSPIAGNGRYLGDNSSSSSSSGHTTLDQLGDTYSSSFRHIGSSLSYYLLSANTEFPPYETFWGDQLPRATNDIGKTIDRHIFNFDWNDPYASSRYGR